MIPRRPHNAGAPLRPLLPRSAAPFAQRCPPIVVWDDEVVTREPWLSQTLKDATGRISIRSSRKHKELLENILGNEGTTFYMCTIQFPTSQVVQLKTSPPQDICVPFRPVHIRGYVVHVDFVVGHEVVFKLTDDSILALVEYHRTVFGPQAADELADQTEREERMRALRSTFCRRVNSYVYRTDLRALEGLSEGGQGEGELIGGRADEVKKALQSLFVRHPMALTWAFQVQFDMAFPPSSDDPAGRRLVGGSGVEDAAARGLLDPTFKGESVEWQLVRLSNTHRRRRLLAEAAQRGEDAPALQAPQNPTPETDQSRPPQPDEFAMFQDNTQPSQPAQPTDTFDIYQDTANMPLLDPNVAFYRPAELYQAEDLLPSMIDPSLPVDMAFYRSTESNGTDHLAWNAENIPPEFFTRTDTESLPTSFFFPD